MKSLSQMGLLTVVLIGCASQKPVDNKPELVKLTKLSGQLSVRHDAKLKRYAIGNSGTLNLEQSLSESSGTQMSLVCTLPLKVTLTGLGKSIEDAFSKEFDKTIKSLGKEMPKGAAAKKETLFFTSTFIKVEADKMTDLTEGKAGDFFGTYTMKEIPGAQKTIAFVNEKGIGFFLITDQPTPPKATLTLTLADPNALKMNPFCQSLHDTGFKL